MEGRLIGVGLTQAEIEALLYAAAFLRDRDPSGLPYDTVALAEAECALDTAVTLP